MDFALPLIETESTSSQSNIRYVPPLQEDSVTGATPNDLDQQVICAANQAAYELFWGSSSHATALPFQKKQKTKDKEPAAENDGHAAVPSFDPEYDWMLDGSIYKDRVTPMHPTIQPGDLVVIQESFDSLDFVYVKRGAIFQNRNGNFHHNDFIDQPFGTKVRSRDLRGYGFIYLLKPTPELWTRSLNHRTQVVHELDQSQILFQLYVRPNDVVVESGTGSGALSHALIRAVAPSGHLHTYEYNRHRAETARCEFQQHGLQHLVTVHHKDVCRGLVEAATNDTPAMNGATMVQEGTPGFDLPGQSVNAVVLDLPEPWLAVPHAAYILKPNARMASYSPCVEQTQKTIQAMEAAGFHSIKTMEYRLQEHYVDEVEYEPPPSVKLSRPAPHDIAAYQSQNRPDEEFQEDNEINNDGEEAVNPPLVMAEETTTASATSRPVKEGKVTRPAENGGSRKRKMLVARPFVMMRGHSAFLTFATAGLAPIPCHASGDLQLK
jgi:tRNA (adenine57-N1/adenine58-N1)-methyltransferase catalytic subunit